MLASLPRGFRYIEELIIDYVKSKKETSINIAYIGANDGVYNNPLYNILLWKANDINILISEPQEELISILNDHLHFLKNKTITNTLINDGSEKNFYSIKPEHYHRYGYPFLKNKIPVYVSPTVISSCNQTFFLKKYYDKGFNPRQLLWESHVNVTRKQSTLLVPWLLEHQFSTSIDILLIMAQGEDKTILYHNNWDLVKPNIIICDNTNWPEEEVLELQGLLELEGYVCDSVYSYSRFMIATKKIS